MEILLTGATGFLGQHLVRCLVAAGHSVTALVRGAARRELPAFWTGAVEVVDLDVVDPRRILEQAPEIATVIHAATSYGRGVDLRAVLEANVALPLALVDGLNARGGGVFINTDTCFNKHSGDYRYLAAYTTAKQQLLDWLRLAVGDGKLGVANLRLEHPYGPGDAPSKMVTGMIRRCLAGEAAIPLTPGEQRRDFVYIDDVVQAYLAVLNRGLPMPGAVIEYQVGSGQSVSIRELMGLMVDLCGSATRLDFGALPYRDNEIMQTAADLKTLEALGYRPQVCLREGLARTLAAERAAMVFKPGGADDGEHR